MMENSTASRSEAFPKHLPLLSFTTIAKLRQFSTTAWVPRSEGGPVS